MRLIIVGAGIVGAACAYTAAALGAEVILIDAERPGRATAAGAGIICPWTAAVDDPAWYDFARTAAREYPALIAALADQGEPDVSYRRVGALLLEQTDQPDQADVAQAARQRLAARSAGAPEMGEVSLLDGTQAQELFPPLRPGAAAVHIAGAARVDGRQLAAALVRAAVRKGATVRTGAATLSCHAGLVAGVSVADDLVEADAGTAIRNTERHPARRKVARMTNPL